MEISVSSAEGRVPVTIFHLEGDLTVESYEQLQQQAEDAFEAGTRHLLLDFTGVKFMSSSGLRAINYVYGLLRGHSAQDIEAAHQGVKAGTYKSSHLKLLKPRPDVLRTLKTAGFDMFLEIYSDPQEAIASF